MPWALLAAVMAALAILIGLGVWQLERAKWKTGLLEGLRQALNAAPQPFSIANAASGVLPEFQRVSLGGRFRENGDVWVYSATPAEFDRLTREGYGYFLFSAVDVDGRTVLVSRGFVPASLAFRDYPRPALPVDGIVRLSEQPTRWTPEPDRAKRVFYAADLNAIASGLDLTPSTVLRSQYVELTPVPGQAGTWPAPRNPETLLGQIPNRHFEYALTWFGLAATLLAIAAIYVFRRKRPVDAT